MDSTGWQEVAAFAAGALAWGAFVLWMARYLVRTRVETVDTRLNNHAKRLHRVEVQQAVHHVLIEERTGEIPSETKHHDD